MEPKSVSGFREVSHTADWELEVWAPDLANLLQQAVIGMYQLCEAEISDEPPLIKKITLHYSEPEILLIDFLTELIFFIESENLIFDDIDLQFRNGQLIADLKGSVYQSISKEIKAVTYHNLQIRKAGSGLVANIIFDV